jgi:hypothetical protein
MLNGSANKYSDNITKLEWQTRTHVNASRLNPLHDLREELPDHHQMIIDTNHWFHMTLHNKEDDRDLTDNQFKSGNCPSKLVFLSTHPFSSRDYIDKKPHICFSSFSESSLSYSPSDSSIDLNWLSVRSRSSSLLWSVIWNQWLVSIIIWWWSGNSSLRSCKWFSHQSMKEIGPNSPGLKNISCSVLLHVYSTWSTENLNVKWVST